MPQLARLPWPLRLLAAELCALALWTFVVNRAIVHWANEDAKHALALLLCLGLGVGSAVAVLSAQRELWLRVCVGLLTAFAVGELERLWLRHEYGANSPDVALSHPVTTWQLEVRHSSLALARLDRDLRVAHISDLHISEAMPASFIAQTERELLAQDADLLLLTGDYVSNAHNLPLFERWLAGLPRARLGTYAVLGNHEYWAGCADAVRAALERAGVQLVSGRCLRVPQTTLTLCGTDEPWGTGFAAPAPSQTATVVLSHTPDNVYALAEQGVDVVFAGHTHGGQLRLPGLGALVVPSRYGRLFDQGRFDVDGTHLFVSAGVGADAPALRLWCPPELVVVELLGQAAKSAAR